ncbi:hypothetical protein BDW62DRAFT_188931, partial [Aspergillus aurantiobrunneus]
MAYHSIAMEEIATEYQTAIADMEPGERRAGPIPMMSSVTRDTVTAETLRSPRYWARNLTSTVEFEGALVNLVSQLDKQPQRESTQANVRVSHLLEIGPHKALEGPVRETLRAVMPKAERRPVYVPLSTRWQDAHLCLLAALGNLHCTGHPVNLLSANGTQEIPPLPMPRGIPAYPFNNGRSYWKEGRLSQNLRFRSIPRHDLLGSRGLDWNEQIAQWRNILRV